MQKDLKITSSDIIQVFNQNLSTEFIIQREELKIKRKRCTITTHLVKLFLF